MADIKYIVECDATGALKSIKDLDASLDNAAKTTDKAGGSFGGLWKQFAIGQIAVAALHKGYAAFKNFVEGSVKAAIEAEQAENNLNAALEITGRTVEGNIQHYKKFAAEQMRATTYTDEQVMASQALLLQLTNLDQNGIDRATKGAMGLASTMGIDLHSATMMVTKAMEGNYGALGRVGIRVGENLTAEQKQASLLDQLIRLYGRSTAETNTFGGAVKQLTNAWDEVQETVGGAIVKNESFKEAIKDLKAWVDKLATSPDFQLWLNTVIDGMMAAAKFTGKFAGACRDLMMNVFGATKADRELTEAQVKLNAALDRATAAGHDYRGRMDAIRAAAAAAAPKIDEVGKKTHALTAEQVKAGEAAKKAGDALAKAAQDIINKYKPLHAAMKAAFDEQKVLTAAWKAGRLSAADYKAGMDASTKSLRAFGDTITTAVLPKAKKMEEVFAKAISKMQKGPAFVTAAYNAEVPKWLAEVQKVLDKEVAATSTALNAIEAAMQQSLTNKLAMLDEEYQARLDLINNSVMNETEKEAAITALDAEYSMKRRQAEVEAAKKAKLIAIAEAIINTAEGVTKAWAQGGALFGPILAAIVAAAGAVQIALIRSQPIGAAKGAIFKERALLMSQATGQEYEVAEGGEAEIVSSPRQLREAIMGRGARGGGAAGQPITLHNYIYIDGKEMKAFITKTIREGTKSENMLIHPRAIRAY